MTRAALFALGFALVWSRDFRAFVGSLLMDTGLYLMHPGPVPPMSKETSRRQERQLLNLADRLRNGHSKQHKGEDT